MSCLYNSVQVKLNQNQQESFQFPHFKLIIIQMIIRIALLLHLLAAFLSQISCIQQEVSKIHLLTHQWCRKCDKAVNIMQKIQINLGSRFQPLIENLSQKSQLHIEIINLSNDFIYQGKEQSLKNNYGHKNTLQKQDLSDQQHSFYEQQTAQNNSQIIYDQIYKKYNISKSQVPFPIIWFSCKNFKGIYQNQITYEQIQYWIGIYCFGRIPYCKKDQQKTFNNRIPRKNDYQFQIESSNFINQHQKLLTFQRQNQFIKFCLTRQNTKIEIKHQKVLDLSQIVRGIKQKPLFFSKFNHNVRNSLFEGQQEQISQKLGIFLIFNEALHPKVKQFIDIFKFLSDQMHGDKDYHINQGKLGQLFYSNQSHVRQLQSQYHQMGINTIDLRSKREIIQNLVFVGACYNQNKRQCVLKYQYEVQQQKQQRQKDQSLKPIIHKYQTPFSFAGSKTNNLRRLLQFAQIKNHFESQVNQDKKKRSVIQIVALHFDKERQKIKGYEFDDVSTKLGSKFLFWMFQTYNRIFSNQLQHNFQHRAQQNRKQGCLSSELIHILSQRNLSSIRNNIRIGNQIQKLNNKLTQYGIPQIKFRTLVKQKDAEAWNLNKLHNQNQSWTAERFKLCFRDQLMKMTDNFNEVLFEIEKWLVVQKGMNRLQGTRATNIIQLSDLRVHQIKIKNQKQQQEKEL